MDYKNFFQMPKSKTITGRSSSITNAFINSIIPVIYPTVTEVKQALEILEIDPNNIQCAYCGSVATEWDHMRPLVKDQKPTGYISEIHNLVPSCGKCNQSKGNKPWEEWMLSDARLSPKSKGISDLDERIERLKAYENWETPTPIDIKRLIGNELWDRHWVNWISIIGKVKDAQSLAAEINQIVSESYKNSL